MDIDSVLLIAGSVLCIGLLVRNGVNKHDRYKKKVEVADLAVRCTACDDTFASQAYIEEMKGSDICFNNSSTDCVFHQTK